VAPFDYQDSAELYPSRRYAKTTGQQYRRFVTAAAAIQFMIEGVPSASLAGSFLEVGDQRYEGKQIRELYDADAYPLHRPTVA